MFFCECGCKGIPRKESSYIHGHNFKNKVQSYDHTCKRAYSRTGKWPQSPMRKECKCGCGKLARSGNEFVLGHAAKVMSQEQKDKISKRLTGKPHPHSEEARRNMSKAHMGITFSQDHRENLSIGQKKRLERPGEIKRLSDIRKLRMGSDAPNWKGGISCEPYCDAWADKEYKEDIRKRDNYQCQNPSCSIFKLYARKLDLHHIDYDKKNCSPINLISLCRNCNTKANGNRRYWQKFYMQLIDEKNQSVGNLC